MRRFLKVLFFFTCLAGGTACSFRATPALLTSQVTPLPDKEKVVLDAQALEISPGFTQNLRWNLPLDTVGPYGSSITWRSSKPAYVSDNGTLLKRSPWGGKKVKVNFRATIKAGNAKTTKTFQSFLAFEEPHYDGYLFAYFEGSGEGKQQEQLRFGVSADAVNWYALNKNQPILASSEISQTGGIRDPHLLRSEDGTTFFLVATDMFTHKNGWNTNPGLVMLRSNDLLQWTDAIIDLEKAYPKKFRKVKWVWAPQTIYDPAAGKYLVYFTVRFHDDLKLDFYSAYANADFTAFENEPQLMFQARYGAIDGDILYKDGTYHFFYKGNTKNEQGVEFKNGIQKATAPSLQGPWTEDFRYMDAYAGTKTHVEGSSVFKLNNSDSYILMYDLYSSQRYEFQRTNNLSKFTQKPESFTKNFNPRHGSVIGITRQEAQRLHQKWGGVPASLLKLETEAERK